jgi:uncharacterized protein YegL
VAMASFCVDVPAEQAQAPLRLKLLLDCSGSMGGDSIAAAKRALHEILSRLEPTDRFSLTRFGSSVVHVTPGFGAADTAAVARTAKALRSIEADLGGTEMEQALVAVFALGDREQTADVLVITDGEVWGADVLADQARAAQQRVFVVGIGSAPAEGVLRKLALASGGACEFIAPNEGVQQAILRMFLRLRAPRVERAEIVWPGEPRWVTPLPAGLFGGETIHAYAGYATPPVGDAVLKLHSAGDAAPLIDRVAMQALLADEATLPRMAAAMRIDSAKEKEALELALRYQLLTGQTNCVIVHERAADEKATGLPQLQKIAQMHAAGWGGVGTVMNLAHLDLELPAFSRTSAHMKVSAQGTSRHGLILSCLDSPAVLGDLQPPSATDLHEPFHDLLVNLDASVCAAKGAVSLPDSVDGLVRGGLEDNRAIELVLMGATGNDEALVVRAFLEALLPLAKQLKLSRQFLRLLRHQFASRAEHQELRQQIGLWVASTQLAVIE